MRRCDIEGCPNPHSGLGMCGVHYKRWTRGTLARPPHVDPRPFCPTCGTNNTVAYYAVDGVILEWRCMDIDHVPDSFLGRNFIIAGS